jgi:hypothetical protein
MPTRPTSTCCSPGAANGRCGNGSAIPTPQKNLSAENQGCASTPVSKYRPTELDVIKAPVGSVSAKGSHWVLMGGSCLACFRRQVASLLPQTQATELSNSSARELGKLCTIGTGVKRLGDHLRM